MQDSRDLLRRRGLYIPFLILCEVKQYLRPSVGATQDPAAVCIKQQHHPVGKEHLLLLSHHLMFAYIYLQNIQYMNFLSIVSTLGLHLHY